ncbi:penicillin-binding transpeptidase domain-containing protein [Thermasporomyces composti]|uniref:Cell division protein FtsI/penicillin-binding protein 2 n=1 Tax=Thermasporomyces composti TaxID=696763 RepID=A0A3D9V1G1_THECX|nr:penicillin-binding transpeptidase domain-containing protein [Thermasporomyces composti]REF35632.1 cell division protein FtsI/penicillin-binding protein 2 [Thermasporomyces composti]
MCHSPRRWVAVATAASAVLAGCASEPQGPPPEARSAVVAFASAWSKGDLGSTVDERTREAADTTLASAARALAIERTTVRPTGSLRCLSDEEAARLNDGRGVCRHRLSVAHDLKGLGTWSYVTTAEVREDAHGDWRVWWTHATFHPKLTPTAKLVRRRELPPRAPILDGNGDPLTEERPVIRVGVDPTKLDPNVTYRQLRLHLGVDPGELRQRVKAAGAGARFVPAITVREEVWDNVAGHFDDTPGVVTREDTMPLAPTPTYARAVLGTVGPPTPEALEDAGPLAAPTDDVGLTGLQRAFQRRLAGTPGGRVVVEVPNTGDRHVLFRQAPRPGVPLKTTLDPMVQEAAENVVAGQTKPTSIVAVRASTGEILAVANGPGVTSYNRAFVGRYPPGSTFKVISAAALLEAGLGIDDRVSCPAETFVGGKRFKNAYGGSRSDGPFRVAFAHSCNTTIVERAEGLSDDALRDVAERFGIGATWQLGLPAFSGSVPPPRDLVEKAASMIGQGRVEVSVLGMAMVAAAVASGQPRVPVLLPEDAPGGPVGEPLPERLHQDLRALMRAVVETGSARQLDLIGEPVHAKTGTAEYGSANPPHTHAWMIGFRGDIAFAIVIEGGGAGGRDAGPVAVRFLEEARFAH